MDLYNQANGHLKYKSLKHCQQEVVEILRELREDVILLDLNEQKLNQKEIIFILFHTQRKIILETLCLEPMK